jgi:hypothetical protein
VGIHQSFQSELGRRVEIIGGLSGKVHSAAAVDNRTGPTIGLPLKEQFENCEF